MRKAALAVPALLLLSLPALAKRGREEEGDRDRAARIVLPADALDAKAKPLALARSARVLDATAPQWINLGPDAGTGDGPDALENDAGRLTAVVLDPADPLTIYIASAGGGVWRCQNADPTQDDWNWEPLTDDLTATSADGSIAAGGLAISPVDSSTLYLAMGDRYSIGPASRGLFVTHDRGDTWTPMAGNIGNATHTRDILPIGASTILIAADNGLWRSTDGGNSFTQPVVPGLSVYEAWHIRRLTDLDLVLTTQDDANSGVGGVFVSHDSGATWTASTISSPFGVPGRIVIDTAPAASTTAVAGLYEDLSSQGDLVAPGVIVSTNGGASFTFKQAPLQPNADGLFQEESGDGGQGSYSIAITMDPTNPTHYFAGANFATYRSLDGGATWQWLTEWYAQGRPYAHADLHVMVWATSPSKTLYMGNDGGLSLLRDPDRSYAAIQATGSGDYTFVDNRHNKGVTTELLYNLGSSDAPGVEDLVTAGAQDNGTIVRQVVGTSMASSTVYDENITGDGFGTQVHPKNGNEVVGTSYYGYIYKSTDGGATFPSIGSGLDPNEESFFTDVKPGYADATGDTLFHNSYFHAYKSVNFGDDWTAMPLGGVSPSDYLLAINSSHQSVDHVIVGTLGHGGYATYDGGSSWRKFPKMPGSGSLFPNSGFDDVDYVWMDGLDDKILYVASQSQLTTKSHLWKSTDGGGTFTAIDGLTTANGFPAGLPVHVIQNDPRASKVLYAGTEVGLYRSEDGGKNWSRYGNGLPWVSVTDLWIRPDGGQLRISTFGRGIWQAPTEAVPPDAGGGGKKGGCGCSLDGGDAGALGGLFAGLAAIAAIVRRRR